MESKCQYCGITTPKQQLTQGKCGLCENAENIDGVSPKKKEVISIDMRKDGRLYAGLVDFFKPFKDGTTREKRTAEVSDYFDDVEKGRVTLNGKTETKHCLNLFPGDEIGYMGRTFIVEHSA